MSQGSTLKMYWKRSLQAGEGNAVREILYRALTLQRLAMNRQTHLAMGAASSTLPCRSFALHKLHPRVYGYYALPPHCQFGLPDGQHPRDNKAATSHNEALAVFPSHGHVRLISYGLAIPLSVAMMGQVPVLIDVQRVRISACEAMVL